MIRETESFYAFANKGRFMTDCTWVISTKIIFHVLKHIKRCFTLCQIKKIYSVYSFNVTDFRVMKEDREVESHNWKDGRRGGRKGTTGWWWRYEMSLSLTCIYLYIWSLNPFLLSVRYHLLISGCRSGILFNVAGRFWSIPMWRSTPTTPWRTSLNVGYNRSLKCPRETHMQTESLSPTLRCW